MVHDKTGGRKERDISICLRNCSQGSCSYFGLPLVYKVQNKIRHPLYLIVAISESHKIVKKVVSSLRNRGKDFHKFITMQQSLETKYSFVDRNWSDGFDN